MTGDCWPTESGVTLLAPGLLGPVPVLPEQVPDTPALDLVLRRGLGRGHYGDGAGGVNASLTTRLLQLFGAVASAPYARAADDAPWDRSGWVAHADPVHLRPDRDQLRLFDARHLGMIQEEADALVGELNGHLAGSGMRLVAPTASRWYLELAEQPGIESMPLDAVTGRAIEQVSPQGPDAGRWAALLTEVQMLLFNAPVNQTRQQRGQPTVNAVWISGAGHWLPLDNARRWQRLCSDQTLVRGLAEAAGMERLPASGNIERPGTLAVADEMADAMLDADPDRWASAASLLNARLEPALTAVRAGSLGGLELDLCDGRSWCATRPSLRRFWRRGPGLKALAAARLANQGGSGLS